MSFSGFSSARDRARSRAWRGIIGDQFRAPRATRTRADDRVVVRLARDRLERALRGRIRRIASSRVRFHPARAPICVRIPRATPDRSVGSIDAKRKSTDAIAFFSPFASAGMGCSPPHIALLSGLQGTGMTARQVTDVLHRLAMQFGPVKGRLLPRCKCVDSPISSSMDFSRDAGRAISNPNPTSDP